jgi:hypothetical protein
MHQANGIFRGLFPIVVDALYQGTGAVPNSNNSYFYFAHSFVYLLYKHRPEDPGLSSPGMIGRP